MTPSFFNSAGRNIVEENALAPGHRPEKEREEGNLLASIGVMTETWNLETWRR